MDVILIWDDTTKDMSIFVEQLSAKENVKHLYLFVREENQHVFEKIPQTVQKFSEIDICTQIIKCCSQFPNSIICVMSPLPLCELMSAIKHKSIFLVKSKE